MTISSDRLSYLTNFFKKETGLAIDDSKVYLVRTRLRPLARKYGFKTLELLIDEIRKNERGDLAAEALDQMTTNETLFFRDAYPFKVLKKHLFPEMLENKRGFGKIKIWSAAASTGQEAYSIAMTAVDEIAQANSRVKIIGTDVSTASIIYAKEAIYKQMEIQRGLPAQNLKKYFLQKDENAWQVKESLRSMVHFQEANLIAPTLVTGLRHYALFDIVFCRNVLIYFDVEQRKLVIDQIAKLMETGGYLFTGAGEMVEGKQSKWETVRFENRPVWRLLAKH